jgi:hypothetical protein
MLLQPQRTYPNMFDAHPPFQIDGNLCGAAGIGQMLLQSHSGMVHLLPCLPNSCVSGLRARGDLEVGLRWSTARWTTHGKGLSDTAYRGIWACSGCTPPPISRRPYANRGQFPLATAAKARQATAIL